MPRIKSKAAEYAAKDFQKAVRIGRAALDIRQCTLAEQMGICASTLSEKLATPERMTVLDLRKLLQARVITDTDLLKLIRADIK